MAAHTYMERFYQTPTFKLTAAVVFLLLSCILSFWAETSALAEVLFNFFIRFLFVIMFVDMPPMEYSPETIRSLVIFFIASGTFLIMFMVTLFLASSFILPVSNTYERFRVWGRLITYILRGHGPAIFVRGGIKVASPEELDRRGPGIILADLSSAVVLEGGGYISSILVKNIHKIGVTLRTIIEGNQRTKNTRVRVESPGIIFLDGNEKPRGSTDLRPQFRIRPGVIAVTRDGIDVSANLFTRFTLGAPPEVLLVTFDGDPHPDHVRVVQIRTAIQNGGTSQRQVEIVQDLSDELDAADRAEIYRFAQGQRTITQQVSPPKTAGNPNAPFTFDEKRIFDAVYGKAHDPTSDRHYTWDDLPADVAAQIFRDLIARESFNALYKFEDENPNAYQPAYRPDASSTSSASIQRVKAVFSQRMRNQGVMSYRFAERKGGKPITKGSIWVESEIEISPIQDLRTPKVLRRRGIKVFFAGFSVLTPVNEAIRIQLLDHWKARWDRKEIVTHAEYQLRASVIIARAKARAQKDLTRRLNQLFKEHKHSEAALTMQLYEAIETLAADADTHSLLPADTLNVLNNLRYWIKPVEQSLFSETGTPPVLPPGYAGPPPNPTGTPPAEPTIIEPPTLPPAAPAEGHREESLTAPMEDTQNLEEADPLEDNVQDILDFLDGLKNDPEQP